MDHFHFGLTIKNNFSQASRLPQVQHGMWLPWKHYTRTPGTTQKPENSKNTVSNTTSALPAHNERLSMRESELGSPSLQHNLNTLRFRSPFIFSSRSTAKHKHFHSLEVCPIPNKPQMLKIFRQCAMPIPQKEAMKFTAFNCFAMHFQT